MSNLIFFFLSTSSVFLLLASLLTISATPLTSENLEEFVHDLSKKSDDLLHNITMSKNETNNTEIIEILKTEGIRNFSQSAQVMRLTGIKDLALPDFINRFISRLKLPEEHKEQVLKNLNRIAKMGSRHWQSYKFIYTKANSNNTCYYMCILAQHDYKEQKSNWVYTEIHTTLHMNDIFVISRIETIGTRIVDTTEVITKPADLNDIDIDMVVKFYDVVSTQSFANYLGILN